jgi:hypothetical protein
MVGRAITSLAATEDIAAERDELVPTGKRRPRDDAGTV